MYDIVREIDIKLKEIYRKLDQQLSLDRIGFDINFKESNYSFYPATTPAEQRKMQKKRTVFIKRLLKDVLKNAVDAAVDGELRRSTESIWASVISFDNAFLSSWDSEIINEDTQEIRYQEDAVVNTGQQRDLDYDSQYIFAQRQDLTPEMFQEFIQKKYGDVFDSNLQHANMTPEDSTQKIEV